MLKSSGGGWRKISKGHCQEGLVEGAGGSDTILTKPVREGERERDRDR